MVGDGVFHADLHAGNVLVWPDGSAGLLDFGAVGRLDSPTGGRWGLLLWAVDADSDPVLATDCMIALLDRPEGLGDKALQREIEVLITRFRTGFGSGTGSLDLFGDLFGIVIRRGFAVPPQLAAAVRSLGALEGTLTLRRSRFARRTSVRAVVYPCPGCERCRGRSRPASPSAGRAAGYWCPMRPGR